MCIIMMQKPGKKIIKNVASQAWQSNTDGGGYMFCHDDKVIVRKGFFEFAKFWETFRADRETYGSKSPFVVHFRYATKGTVDQDNCHPFQVSPKLGLVHNGTFKNLPVKKDESDTAAFAKRIVRGLPDDFESNPAIMQLIRGFADSSRIVFLRASGKVAFVNEDLGLWEGGIWYSNTYFKTYRQNLWNTRVNARTYNETVMTMFDDEKEGSLF